MAGGFLGSALGFVGPALTAATEGAGAYKGAELQAKQLQFNQQIQTAMLMRQLQNQEVLNQYRMAQAKAALSRGDYYGARQGAIEAGPQTKFKPQAFTVDGKPTLGFADDQGNFYDAAKHPVTGAVGPFTAPEKKNPSEIPGTPEWKDAQRFRASLAPSPNVYVPGTNPQTGQPEIFAGKTRGDPSLTPMGVGRPAGGASGAMSGMMMQQMARMGMSRNDIANAIKQMDAYENNPKNLENLSALKQATGAAASVVPDQHAHGALGALNNFAGSLMAGGAQKALQTTDPEFRRYLYNAQRVGTAFTEILPRPNQQLLGIERGLSGVDVGWSPGLVGDIQARRHNGLAMLDAVLGQSPLGNSGALTAGGASPGTAPAAPTPKAGKMPAFVPKTPDVLDDPVLKQYLGKPPSDDEEDEDEP